jgi:chemotaxis protein MotA
MADKADKAPAKPGKLRSTRLDVSTLGGLVLALAGILGGLILDGGKITDLTQVTAVLIVLGGTFGAVMITNQLSTVLAGFKDLKYVFFEEVVDPNAGIEEIIAYATKARKSSIISLEEDLDKISDPFLQKALSLAVDGTDLQEIKNMMELEIVQAEKRDEQVAKVWEAAGGYSPTIGIIGAVMGLIQVMKHLENIDEVGRGIAVAFVATVYGVAVANLFFLPAANKLKGRIQRDVEAKELLLEGVGSIVEGLNPKLIRVKLEAFVHKAPAKGAKESKKAAAAAAQTA